MAQQLAKKYAQTLTARQASQLLAPRYPTHPILLTIPIAIKMRSMLPAKIDGDDK